MQHDSLTYPNFLCFGLDTPKLVSWHLFKIRKEKKRGFKEIRSLAFKPSKGDAKLYQISKKWKGFLLVQILEISYMEICIDQCR